jgi:predicted transposase YbfD/YdcC
MCPAWYDVIQRENCPQQLLRLIRSYWGIEKGLHCRRDLTLREDPTHMSKRNATQLRTCLNNLGSKID